MKRTSHMIKEGEDLLHYVIYHNSQSVRKPISINISGPKPYPTGKKGTLQSELEDLVLVCQLTGKMPGVYPFTARKDRHGFPYLYQHPIHVEIDYDVESLKKQKRVYMLKQDVSWLSKTLPESVPGYGEGVMRIFRTWYRNGLDLLAHYVFERNKLLKKSKGIALKKSLRDALQWPMEMVLDFEGYVQALKR